MWFHKDCVDMGSFTFLSYSTTSVSWICCRCNHSNFDKNVFHSFEIETTNNFGNLISSGSENVVNSPNSDFAPTQHSSPIPPFRPKNPQRNWHGTECWPYKDTPTSETPHPEYQVLRRDRTFKSPWMRSLYCCPWSLIIDNHGKN